MEMTIDKAISWLLSIAEHEGDDIPIYDTDVEAIQVAIEIMRKYQKIEEIVCNYGFDTSWLCLKKIREVIDNGNDD